MALAGNPEVAVALAQSDAGLVPSEYVEGDRLELVPVAGDPDDPFLSFAPMEEGTGWRWALTHTVNWTWHIYLGQRADGSIYPDMGGNAAVPRATGPTSTLQVIRSPREPAAGSPTPPRARSPPRRGRIRRHRPQRRRRGRVLPHDRRTRGRAGHARDIHRRRHPSQRLRHPRDHRGQRRRCCTARAGRCRREPRSPSVACRACSRA